MEIKMMMMILSAAIIYHVTVYEACIPSIGAHMLIDILNNSYWKNAIFWDVTSCGSCKSRCFRGM
jgi:hypothetical protein